MKYYVELGNYSQFVLGKIYPVVYTRVQNEDNGLDSILILEDTTGYVVEL